MNVSEEQISSIFSVDAEGGDSRLLHNVVGFPSHKAITLTLSYVGIIYLRKLNGTSFLLNTLFSCDESKARTFVQVSFYTGLVVLVDHFAPET
jgi:hypothetical protein